MGRRDGGGPGGGGTPLTGLELGHLEKPADPVAPPAGASVGEIMKHRLATEAGKQKYKLRQQTVEPVFGIIQRGLGFRRLMLRGIGKVKLEWTLVCAAYNRKRLHRLGADFKVVVAG